MNCLTRLAPSPMTATAQPPPGPGSRCCCRQMPNHADIACPGDTGEVPASVPVTASTAKPVVVRVAGPPRREWLGSMEGRCVTLVARSPEPMGAARLAHVAQALQTQVDRDFSAAWGARARVRAAPGTAAPAGAWPIYLVEVAEMGPGIHVGDGGDPFAEGACGDGWPLAGSHLLLEMIADPRRDRLW